MREIWNDKEVFFAISSSINNAMEDSCKYLTEEIRGSMVPGTGRWWPSRKSPGSLHQASVPGVPPAPDTEELKESISWATSSGASGGGESGDAKVSNPYFGTNTGIFAGNIGTTNFKGVIHELGYTINGDKRPFLRPMLNARNSEILKIMSKNKI